MSWALRYSKTHEIERPLWSLANIDAAQFDGLPVEFSMSEKLIEIRRQMLGEKAFAFTQRSRQRSRRPCVLIKTKGSIGSSGCA